MTTIIACLIAAFSTTAFIVLWFAVVKRELDSKQKAMEAAKYQLMVSRQQYMRLRGEPSEADAYNVMSRSAKIYKQSVDLYNQALEKLVNVVPGKLLGFRVNKDANTTDIK